jgi:hypothetical protein
MPHKVRLQKKSGELVQEIELPIFGDSGIPDVVVFDKRVFLRRPPIQIEKPGPEIYIEELVVYWLEKEPRRSPASDHGH